MMRIRLPYKDIFKKISLLLALLVAILFNAGAQSTFSTVGNAFSTGNNCYTLTQYVSSQRGAVWHNNRIDLNQNFDISFTLNFGSNGGWGGGDGMAFVLQPVNNAQLGAPGSAIGYGSDVNYAAISPSIDIEYDTYTDDGGYNSHTALGLNGNYLHYTGQGVDPVSIGYVTNGANHTSRVIWDAANKIMTLYFDGAQKFTYQKDIVNQVFSGQNFVYFGFTASTGGSVNQQSVCIDPASTFHEYAAVPPPAPNIIANGPTNFCQGGFVNLSTSSAAKNSLQFNGSNYVEAASTPAISLTNALTVEAWIKTDNPDAVQYFVTKGINDQSNGQYGLVLAGGFQFHMWQNGHQGIQGVTQITAGVWYHVAGTWDGNTASLYINGNLEAQSSFIGPMDANTEPLRIGELGLDCCPYPVYGSVDEVRIWNRARTQSEIQLNMNRNVAANPSLVAYYKLDEVNGSTTADAANGNTASLINGPSWQVSGAPINYASYLWSSGANTPAINVNASGSYSVTVTDANGNSGTSSPLNVSSIAPPTIGGTFSVCTGSTTILTGSGTPAATNPWVSSNPAIATVNNAGFVTGVAAGTVMITYTNDGGCSQTAMVTVTFSAPFDFTITSNNSCNGPNNGSANVNFAGGVSPYTISWSNGAGYSNNTDFNIYNLAAGIYSATARDFCGTQVSKSVNINQPAPLDQTVTVSGGSQILCAGGSITLTAATASMYSWEKVLYGNVNPVIGTTQSINVTDSGYYYARLTDANGCVTFSNGIGISLASSNPITVNVYTNGLSCNGPNHGYANVNFYGGKPPLTFLGWSDALGNSRGDSLYINTLSAGTYKATVKDACGTQVFKSFSITEPPPFLATITASGTASNFVNVCPGGSVTLTLNEPSPEISHTWFKNVNGVFTDSIAFTPTLIVNSSGYYGATVLTPSGCLSSVPGISVNVLTAAATAFTFSVTGNNSCGGVNTGSASADLSGFSGIRPVTFVGWTDGGTFSSTNTFINNLAPGTYTATARDYCGAVVSKSVTIIQPAPFVASITASGAVSNSVNVCPGGSVTLTLNESSPETSHRWFKNVNGVFTDSIAFSSTLTVNTSGYYGVTALLPSGCFSSVQGISVNVLTAAATAFTFSVTGTNSCGGPSFGSAFADLSGLSGIRPATFVGWTDGGTFNSTNTFINNLAPGTYTATARDYCGAVVSKSITITGQVTAATITTTTTNVCSGSSTVISITNYNAAYTYQWQKDFIDIPGAKGASYSANLQGSYNVRVSNGGCSNGSNGIFISIAAPLSITINATQSCGGPNVGSAFIQITGGKVPYTYAWTDGGTFSSTSSFINNLPAGTYTATTTDACGNRDSKSVTILVLPAVPLTISGATAICTAGGSTTLIANSGGTPASYSWGKTIGGAFISNIATTQSISTTQAGNYSVSVKDINGCNSFRSVNVTTAGTLLSLTVTGNPSCGGTNFGSANVNFSGSLPMTVAWTDGGTFSSTATSISNLPAGTYTATVTDACGIINSKSVTIGVLPAVTGTISGAPSICSVGGSTTLSANSSGTPATYNWSKTIGSVVTNNIATTQSISVTQAGSYSVSMKDINGCFSFKSVTVTAAGTLLNLTVTANPSCNGPNTGNANVNFSGSLPITVAWTDGGTFSSTANSISGLHPGIYSVTATDFCGLTATKSVTINESAPFILTLDPSGPLTFCEGGSVTLTMNTSGSVASYNWARVDNSIAYSNIATTQSVTATAGGWYRGRVTDVNGCSRSLSVDVYVTQPRVPVLTAEGPTTICPDGIVNLSVSSISNLSKNDLKFTGTNYVEARDTSFISLTKRLTVEAWVKTDNPGAKQYIISKGKDDQLNGQYGLLIDNGKFQFHMWQNGHRSVYGTTPVKAGVWYHVAGTWDSTTALLYVNGVVESSLGFYGPMTANTDPLEIGRLGKSGSPNPFFGEIDEVRIWNVAQTAGQIDSAKGIIINVSNSMVSNYRFEEGTGITTADAGFGNPATLYNSPIWQASTAPFYNYTPIYAWSPGSPGGITSNRISTNVAGTYTATVNAGGCTNNNTSAPITITLLPTTATISASGPLTFCPAGSVVLTANAGTAYLWSTGATTQSITVSQSGNYTVTVTNANGCSATSFPVVVTVEDKIPPVAPVLSDVTGECSAMVTAPTATDNCSGTVTGVTTDPLTYNQQGTYVIHWTFTDAAGNSSSAMQNVSVKDKTPPTITCLSNMSIVATSAAGAVVNYTAPVGTDNCSAVVPTRTAGLASGSVFPIGTTTVTHAVTDAAGLTATCSFTVTVSGLAPVIVVPSNFTANNAAGKCDAVVNYTATETTGIPASTITYSIAPGSVFPVGTTTVTATATNAVGVSTNTFTVTVTDIEKPTFVFPDKTTNVSIPYLQTPVSSWNVVTYNFADPLPAGAVITGIDLSYSAKDQGWGYTGGSTRFYISGTFIGGNVIADHFTHSLSFNYTGSIPGYVSGGNNTFQFGFEGYPGWQGFFYGGTMTIRYQTMATTNLLAPISVNNDAGKCGATVALAIPVIKDNCGVASVTNDAPTLFPIGTTTVTWTATDIHENSNTTTQTVTVADKQPPTVPSLPDITGGCSATAVAPTTTDNCSGTITGTTTDALTYNTQGTHPITWTFDDGHGNITTAIQNVIVHDVTAPVPNVSTLPAITILPGDLIIPPTATDNCTPGTLTATTSDPVTNLTTGTYTITWTYTDANENSVSQTQTVIVKDVQPPAIACLDPITKNNDPGVSGAIVNYTLPVVNDNGSTKTVTITEGGGDGAITFATPLTNNVSSLVFVSAGEFKDIAHGHGESITVTIELFNPHSNVWIPVHSLQTGNDDYHFGGTSINFPLIPQVSQIRFTASKYVGAAFHFYGMSVNINGIGLVQKSGLPSGSLFPIGTTNNKFEAADLAGNKDSCTFTVTVMDNEKPQVINLTGATKYVTTGCTWFGSSGNFTLTDNSLTPLIVTEQFFDKNGQKFAPNVVLTLSKGDYLLGDKDFPIGVNTVVLSVKDASGNVSETVSFKVTVIDNLLPTIVSSGNQTFTANPRDCGAFIKISSPVVSDNCGIKFLFNDYTFTSNASGHYPVGTTLVKWTVVDKNDNKVTATQTITITDNEPPVINIPVSIIQSGDVGICGATVTWPNVTAIDNCGVLNLTANHQSGELFPLGSTLVTYSAIDIHNNVSTASFTVTVTDNEAPTVITKPYTMTLVNGSATITAADINSGSNDKCGPVTLWASKTQFNCSDIGVNLVTLNVTDSHGNTAGANAIVTVVGQALSSGIVVTPENTIYTGGVPTDIYLGYGPQKVTLNDNVTGSTTLTYSWTGSGIANLSCTNCAAPVFAPTVSGSYSFTVTATNQYGCTTTSSVTICVRDIRVPNAIGKVYVCHTDLLTGIKQTLTLSTSTVANQLFQNPQDKLGSCDMTPCGIATGLLSSATTNPGIITLEGNSIKEVNNRAGEKGLSVKVSPNPSNTVFTFMVSTDKKIPVHIRLIDEAGRLAEGLNNAPVGASFKMGDKLINGIYFAEVLQGTERVVLKLIKQNR